MLKGKIGHCLFLKVFKSNLKDFFYFKTVAMIFLKKIIAVVKPLSVTDAFPTFFLRKNIGIKSPVDF